ncbi:MAG: DNA polymerase III subunit beta [Giesbergeria sp.]|uniref:DNA polymerase III subunit beta n=1 Tax=Giesbergeria sp. TaxID=2818473 RepID=UPI002619026F|nr:DNA polymerase III subunit beta [Giesbergeria sp.]MDD2609433.1 DNA polymerase III subunit beta [Giesbergeria sp.]
MKTTIGELRTAMKQAMKAINKGSCAIEIKHNSLYVKASSMEGAVMIAVPTDGFIENCNASLSQKQILAIFNGVADSTVCTFKKVENGIAISFAGARIRLLHPYDGEADSIFETVDLVKQKLFSAEGSKLSKYLNGPLSYAAKNDVRVFLTGVCFESDEGVLQLVGTDGIRLCAVKTDIAASLSANFILPASAAEAIHAVFNDSEFSVEMIGDGDNVRLLFSNDTIKWLVTLIAGTYPNWRKVMPQKNRHAQAVLDRDELVRAVNRVTAASDSVHAALVFSKGRVTVQSIDGEQREEFSAESTLVDDTVVFPFNGKMLTNAVSCVETEKVDIYIDDADLLKGKAVFHSDPLDTAKVMKDWIGFMMPLRVEVTV